MIGLFDLAAIALFVGAVIHLGERAIAAWRDVRVARSRHPEHPAPVRRDLH